MRFFKILLLATLTLLLTTQISFAAESANEILKTIEITTYGREQTGAIIDRLNKLERDYSGKNLDGNLSTRIEALNAIIFENSASPSLLAKVNALEWSLDHNIQINGLEDRIIRLESSIIGKQGEGGFISRIRELSKVSFGKDTVPLMELQLPAETVIKAELLDKVDTRFTQVGDIVRFRVAEDVIVDGYLVFPKGISGTGTVTLVNRANGWGKNGKIIVNFNALECIDGQDIEIYCGNESQEFMTSNKMLLGAALFGINLKSDWDKMMVHGKNLAIPEGTPFYVQTKVDTAIYALQDESAAPSLYNFEDEEPDIFNIDEPLY